MGEQIENTLLLYRFTALFNFWKIYFRVPEIFYGFSEKKKKKLCTNPSEAATETSVVIMKLYSFISFMAYFLLPLRI